jgi:Uma2 family endonuclease
MHPTLGTRLKTATDLASLPDDGYRHELEAGHLLAEPLPAHRHDRVRRRLERALQDFVDAHALGEVFGAVGYVLARDPDTVRGPDLSFVTRERLLAFDDARFFEGAPDLAVEILSPSNRASEMRAKVAEYLAAGTRLVWVVDPERKIVTTYRELLSPRRVGVEGVVDGDDVLPGFTFAVAAVVGGTSTDDV